MIAGGAAGPSARGHHETVRGVPQRDLAHHPSDAATERREIEGQEKRRAQRACERLRSSERRRSSAARYSASVRSAVRSSVNSLRTSSGPRRAIRPANSRSPSTRARARAQAWGSSGATSTPVSPEAIRSGLDRKSTRLNSSHDQISYAVFCLKKK